MVSLSFKAFIIMGCSPARFSKFQTEFYSGCSPFWITCIEIESCRCPKSHWGCIPCFPEVFRLIQEWDVAHLVYQNLRLCFTRVVANFG